MNRKDHTLTSNRGFRSHFYLTVALLLALTAVTAPVLAGTNLAVQDSQFTVNGRPTFLLGISYYAALGATKETWKSDLDEMKRHGFNWLRVWATWRGFGNDVSAVDSDGRAREPYLGKLKELMKECDRRGMVVDVTLSRGNGKNDSPKLPDLAAHLQAVHTLIGALKPWRNWFLDLSNERDVRDARYAPVDELTKLRDEVKRLDVNRLVTASHGGDIATGALRSDLEEAQLDFVCPHRPRDEKSGSQTEQVTLDLLAQMRAIGRLAPILYQEPFRRGYTDWQPGAEDFRQDLQAARSGGAAGWCFHNGATRGAKDGRPRRSFDLRGEPLFNQLDLEERAFVESPGKWARYRSRFENQMMATRKAATVGKPNPSTYFHVVTSE